MPGAKSCLECFPPGAYGISVQTRGRGIVVSKCGYEGFLPVDEGEPVNIYRTYAYFVRGSEPEPDCNAGYTWNAARPCTGSGFSDPIDCHDGISVSNDFDCTETDTVHSCSDEEGIWGSVTLSNLYTTGELLEVASGALGDLPIPGGNFGGGHASRYLDESEASIELQDFQWRVHHHPVPTCYLKVWLRMTTTLEVEGGEPEVTFEDLEYIWNGTGSPCFGDAEYAGDYHNGDWSETIPPPETNGVKSIAILKYSFLPGYEPADALESGFPPEE